MWATGYRRSYPWLQRAGARRARRDPPRRRDHAAARAVRARPAVPAAAQVELPRRRRRRTPRELVAHLAGRLAHRRRPERERSAMTTGFSTLRPSTTRSSWAPAAPARRPRCCSPAPGSACSRWTAVARGATRSPLTRSCAAGSCSSCAGGSSTGCGRPGRPRSARRRSTTADEALAVPIKPQRRRRRAVRAAPDRARPRSSWTPPRAAGAEVRPRGRAGGARPRRGGARRGRGARVDATGAARASRRRIVIGADGLRSPGRPAGRRAPREREAGTRPRSSTATGPASTVEGYHWYYRPGVSAGAIPTSDRRTCVFVAMPAAALRR